jgi:hypothetical protein
MKDYDIVMNTGLSFVTRLESVIALGNSTKSGSSEVVELLCSALEKLKFDREPQLRVSILEQLAKSRQRKAFEGFRTALEDPDVSVNKAALYQATIVATDPAEKDTEFRKFALAEAILLINRAKRDGRPDEVRRAAIVCLAEVMRWY